MSVLSELDRETQTCAQMCSPCTTLATSGSACTVIVAEEGQGVHNRWNMQLSLLSCCLSYTNSRERLEDSHRTIPQNLRNLTLVWFSVFRELISSEFLKMFHVHL